MKILLTISYDGTNYFGWQRQKYVITVQQIIENNLSLLFKQDIKIIGASRTDSKVHALDQKAMFNIERCFIPLEKLPLVINKLLPDDIIITKAEIKSQEFHVRHNVTKKTYEYKILNSEFLLPCYRNYCWHIKNKLDKNYISNATKYFIGTKDFVNFCSEPNSYKDKHKSTIRTIYDFNAKFTYNPDFIFFYITGDGFLYNMIRVIIGTIINFCIKKLDLELINKIFLEKKRPPECITAPPQGLTLKNISY